MAPSQILRRPGEQLVAVAIVVLGLLIALVAIAHGTAIDPVGYVAQAVLITLIGGIGAFYRLVRRDERFASAAMAVALMLLFTTVMATYHYLLLPISHPLIDPWLAWTNTLVSYRWSDWVEWAAGYPRLSLALRWVYQSTLIQISIIILALSWFERWDALDRMMVTLMVSAAAIIAFWSFFPSLSISAFETASPEALGIVMPVVSPAEGAFILDLVQHGVQRIAPGEMTGLIGFPSFHTILALLCVRFAWPIPYLRAAIAILNVAMVPAILLHGSHYVIDLVGGGLFFAAALAVSQSLVARLEVANAQTDGKDAPASRLSA